MSYREPKEFFKNPSGRAAGMVIFLSGSGTNAEKILEFWEKSDQCSFNPLCIVTDRPRESNAVKIGARYNLEVISHDIADFYRERGMATTSLATEKGREIRDEWTAELYSKISGFDIDFGVFAGFVPLTNITDHFPCLNVHPGDLTVCNDQGERTLIGLHTLPILRALKEGFDSLRSSVIIACAYEDEGDGMDEGIVVGLSPEVNFDWQGRSMEYWQEELASRPDVRPEGGWQDELQEFLKVNLEKLKVNGDWIVFPKVVDDFAKGCFAHTGMNLFYRNRESWMPVEIIEYSRESKESYFKSDDS